MGAFDPSGWTRTSFGELTHQKKILACPSGATTGLKLVPNCGGAERARTVPRLFPKSWRAYHCQSIVMFPCGLFPLPQTKIP